MNGRILDALIEYLKTFPMSPQIAMQFPDVKYEPVAGREYLQTGFLPNETQTLYVGDDDLKWYVGFFQVTVVYPKSSGLIAPNDLAGDVIEHFKKGTVIRGSGVSIKINREPWAAAAIEEGAWTRVPVSIPYECLA